MQLAKTIAVLAEGALWRVTGRAWLGERLVAALGESDENVRSVAGIMLAKSGRAAVPVLYRALANRSNLPEVLSLLGDIGDASVETALARFTSDDDEKIARAATDALRVLALRRGGTQPAPP
jgi:HEAT repeat protein